ncbi:hypothetical protein [Ferrovibrio sp.]|uniref:hypothetical protein n=1 Tax=Ferrovibrio sp. TaxID=1917215 RepID=UPI0035162F91
MLLSIPAISTRCILAVPAGTEQLRPNGRGPIHPAFRYPATVTAAWQTAGLNRILTDYAPWLPIFLADAFLCGSALPKRIIR